ncbi:hypothetical protein J5N97_015192 [Dioscorea zingiberensis]|uniref:F-box domain-containing protein n=1 Tax=Dioscorea zingiberensis TaxID=325984 RepID=A0A9D5CWL4_9LILI|nr:hypothetical protein J5N97_015192 [Dioscorea zingiberensis]
MSFRSGASSRLGHGLRSGCPPPVHDGEEAVVVDEGKQSCWANMPVELLHDVLARVEEEDSSWPERKDVVACAGVCKCWRDVVKEIVKTPEVSGKITLPISVKQFLEKKWQVNEEGFL